MSAQARIKKAAVTRTTNRRVRDSVSSDVEVKTRLKPGSLFFITVELLTIYEELRCNFVNSFVDVVTYCCSIERSVSSKRVSNHLHCFLELKEKLLLVKVREKVVDFFGEGVHIDVQACRSRRSALKYISKEDRNVYYNCKQSELHFNKRVFDWASNVTYFSHTDPFVVEHRFCYNYLQKYFNDLKFEKFGKFMGFKKVECTYVGWAMECAIWWNKRIVSTLFKEKQLYLYGPSNVGKSSFVESLIGRHNMDYVFYPGVGKFFMQSFREEFHRVILFEEFQYEFHCKSMLKRLLEGRMSAYPVKCGVDKLIKFNGPIIFVSNFEVIDDDALRNRLFFISADSPFWEALRACLPKEEPEDENDGPETFTLSSSDSEDEGFPEAKKRCTEGNSVASEDVLSEVLYSSQNGGNSSVDSLFAHCEGQLDVCGNFA